MWEFLQNAAGIFFIALVVIGGMVLAGAASKSNRRW